MPFWCLACGDYGLADALANVVLFVPLGWAVSRTGMRQVLAVALIIATTVGIEALQYGIVAGRVASASDILANTAGGVVGLALPRARRWLASSRERMGRAAGVYAGIVAVGVCATTAVQAIALPPDVLRWAQDRPSLPEYTDFTGSLRAVRLGATAAVKPRGVEVAVDLVSGLPDRRRAEIVSTWRPDGSAWMWLDQQGRDLRAHVASASDRLRLRGHSPWLGDVMPAAGAQSVTVEFAAGRFSYRLAVRTAGGEVVRDVRISPGDGWRLLVPFERGRDRWAPLLGGLWMAALLAPLGYLSAARSTTTMSAAAAGAAAFLLLLSVALGCAWLPLAGWCGAAGGLLTGTGMAKWTT